MFTDLYQLTMAQSYFEHEKNHLATLRLLIRKDPPYRQVFVGSGLCAVLDNLQQVEMIIWETVARVK